jgi:hypothetical protein
LEYFNKYKKEFSGYRDKKKTLEFFIKYIRIVKKYGLGRKKTIL